MEGIIGLSEWKLEDMPVIHNKTKSNKSILW